MATNEFHMLRIRPLIELGLPVSGHLHLNLDRSSALRSPDTFIVPTTTELG